MNIWDKISRWCFYGALVLTPLFFLPLTVFPLALNKQLLLVTLIFLSFLFWLIGGLVKKEFIYNKNWLNLIALGLVIFTAFSAWLSGASGIGFFGVNGGEADVFINIFAFGLVFFLAVSLFRGKGEVKRLINLFLISSGIVLVFSLFQLFGIWLLPWQFTQDPAFNPIGSANALAIYLGAVFLIAFSLLHLGSVNVKKPVGVALVILAILSFLTAFFINFWPVLVGWILAMIVLIALNRRSFLPPIILAVSLFWVLVNFGVIPFQPPAFNISPEVTLRTVASWDIAKNTIGEGVKNYVFGSGPATYQYKYSLYRDSSINLSPFWEVRFVQGANAMLTHLVDWGFVGSLLWLAFIIALGVAVFKRSAIAIKKDRALFWAILLALSYLVLMLFFYSQNFVLYFVIFALAGLLLGLGVVAGKSGYTSVSVAGSSPKAIFVSSTAIVLIMLAGGLLYIQGQHYVGAVYFENGIKVAKTIDDVDKSLPDIMKAWELNSRNEVYLQTLSTAYLLKIKNLLSQEGIDKKELQNRFVENLGAAIQAAKKATEVNNLSGVNWLNLAGVYENGITIVNGAEEAAYAAYKKAAELEPSNPVVYAGLGRAYLVAKDYKKAIANFEKAISLKPDYVPPRFLSALAYRQQGETDKAIAQLELAIQLDPNNEIIKQTLDSLKETSSPKEE